MRIGWWWWDSGACVYGQAGCRRNWASIQVIMERFPSCVCVSVLLCSPSDVVTAPSCLASPTLPSIRVNSDIEPRPRSPFRCASVHRTGVEPADTESLSYHLHRPHPWLTGQLVLLPWTVFSRSRHLPLKLYPQPAVFPLLDIGLVTYKGPTDLGNICSDCWKTLTSLHSLIHFETCRSLKEKLPW